MKLLLPINPEHVDSILRGVKKYEFRKVRNRRPIDRIVIYSTAPVSMIVGEAEVTGIVSGSPAEIWARTAEHSGISREFFEAYFRGRSTAFAYRLGMVSRYESPKCLADLGIAGAPQSLVYLPA